MAAEIGEPQPRNAPRPGGLRLLAAQRAFAAALFMGAFLLLVLLGGYAMDRCVRSVLDPRPNPLTPLLGTWVGDHGRIIHLRSDGTGGARSQKFPQRAVTRFRWKVRQERLSVQMLPRSEDYGRRLREFVFGNAATEFNLTVVSSTELHLQDAITGATYIFHKSADPALEIAP